VLTNAGVNCPTGRARVLVRGLAESIDASASRLKAIAADRAEIIATTIQATCRHAGKPPAASMAPQSAKGRAKIECSHLIISSVTQRFRKIPTHNCKAVRKWSAGRPRPAKQMLQAHAFETPSSIKLFIVKLIHQPVNRPSHQRHKPATFKNLNLNMSANFADQLQFLTRGRTNRQNHPSALPQLDK
jgi:hypothetical protein